MKRKILSILLAIGVIASMSVVMTGCGKKDIEPVQTETETTKTETKEDGTIVVTTSDGKTTTTTKTYKDGNVTYEIIETETVSEEELPVDTDGYKITSDPELTVSYIGDAIKNDSYKAKLNGFGITAEKITMNIESDIELSEGYYTINSMAGKKIGQDKIGLTFSKDANGNQIVEFDRTIFDNLPEGSKLEPGWSNNPIFFFLSDSNDNMIIIDAFMSL